MSSTPSRTNSLLKLLNPYSSMSGSTIPHPDTDSPSTMLLRELQGDEAEVEGEEDPRDRERMSPTPTPTSRPSKRVLKSPSTSSEDEDGEPPRSIVFGGARDPQTPNNPIRRASDAAEVMSSGPFRQTGPSSSSASGSTSPGPSTISVYASGMDRTSRDPSTSPEHVVSPRVVPTFREPPRPGPPRRQSSGSKKVSTPSPRLLNGQGYLDPTIPSPLDRKGKVKAGDKGGRRYHTVPNGEDDEEEPHLGRYAGLGMVKGGGTKKTGLDAHEKALWKWVNVDDLDGFLQEVGLAVRFSLVKLL